jgi:hypothetical protein
MREGVVVMAIKPQRTEESIGAFGRDVVDRERQRGQAAVDADRLAE